MKLTIESIQQINLFEQITGAQVKDRIQKDNFLIFIIEEGNIQKALRGLKKVEDTLKKEIHLIGYSPDVQKFILNLIYPEKPDAVRQEGKIIFIESKDSKVKGRIFGRSRERLLWINELVKKYFDIEEVKII